MVPLVTGSRSAAQVFRQELQGNRFRETLAVVSQGNARGRDGMAPSALLSLDQDDCDGLIARMKAGVYAFSPYRERLISKGREKHPRVISLASARDQVVLKILAKVVSESFGLPRPELPQWKVGRLRASHASGEWEEYARIDIQAFYDSIPHRSLFEILKRRIRKPEILKLLRAAIATPTVPLGARNPGFMNLGGVPQGLPISNILAELYLQDIDERFAGDPSISFFRYVDDVLILTKRGSAQSKFDEFEILALQHGLRVHAIKPGGKSVVDDISVPFDYLGYEFRHDRVTVRPSSVAKLEAKLAKTVTSYRYSLERLHTAPLEEWKKRCEDNLRWRLNIVISGCILDGERRGWLTYYSQIDDLALLARLDRLVTRFLERVQLARDSRFKTFVKTWWAINRPNSRRAGYVIDLDNVDRKTQIQVLTQQFHLHRDSLLAATDGAVTEIFKARMRRLVSDLESDIGALS
jgi:RNA-directed DNA polymerase